MIDKPNLVQIKNPRTQKYVKIDRNKATLTMKKTNGPWKGITIIDKPLVRA